MKNLKIYVLIIVVIMLFTSCSKKEEANELTDISLDVYSKELDGFIPNGEFEWRYMGFAEYMQEMSIIDVFETSAKKTYKLSGEILDMSNGESTLDFSLKLKYIVTNDEIIQEKDEEVMMDSEYDSLVILKLPIEQGASWVQEVISSDGQKEKIEAEIVEIIGNSPNRTVRVEYKNKDGSYKEKRSIQEGIGIVSFDKTMKYGSESFEMGYSLDDYYLKGVLSGGKSNEATNTDSKDDSKDFLDRENSQKNVENISEEEEVNKAIVDFNNSWIAYINKDEKDVYDYLVPDGKAYMIIENFNKSNMKQEFAAMEVEEVEVDGNYANARVHEEIIKYVSDEKTTLVYDWTYHLKKIDGRWLINFYESSK